MIETYFKIRPNLAETYAAKKGIWFRWKHDAGYDDDAGGGDCDGACGDGDGACGDGDGDCGDGDGDCGDGENDDAPFVEQVLHPWHRPPPPVSLSQLQAS